MTGRRRLPAYTAASAAAVAATVALDLGVLRTRLLTSRSYWTAYGIVLGFQLLTNGVLTGRHVVRYNPDVILGPRIAKAPIEDLGFGFALVTQTMCAWEWLGRRGRARARAAPPTGDAAARR